MKTLPYALVLSAAAALFVVGCSQKESPAPASGQAMSPAESGTSDSGGGTGVAGKVFERYIVDPLTLPEFKEHLAPRFANLKAEKDNVSLSAVMKVKTWYLGPFDLDKVDKESLGVSFLKNSTDQIARQNMRSIWIDQRLHERKDSTSYDRAVTIAHEWVMAMYMMKFMSFSDFCKIAATTPGGGCGPGDTAELDKLFPPAPLRKLDENDNENIRFITDWFLRNTLDGVVKEVDFQRVLLAHGFDRRFFNAEEEEKPTGPTSVPISRTEMLASLKGSSLTGTMPSLCTGQESNKSTKCKLEFSEVPNAMGVRVTLPGLKAIEFETYLWEETDLSLSNDLNTKDFYTITFFSRQDKFRVGDKSYTLVLTFNKGAANGQVELRSAVLRTGVIVSIDKKRSPICFVRAPRVESLLDDGLIIRREGIEPLSLEKYYANMQPLAVCSDVNVDESPAR